MQSINIFQTKTKNPEYKFLYKSFRNIFETTFNFSFGYPREDISVLRFSKRLILTLLRKNLKNATTWTAPLFALTEIERVK